MVEERRYFPRILLLDLFSLDGRNGRHGHGTHWTTRCIERKGLLASICQVLVLTECFRQRPSSFAHSSKWGRFTDCRCSKKARFQPLMSNRFSPGMFTGFKKSTITYSSLQERRDFARGPNNPAQRCTSDPRTQASTRQMLIPRHLCRRRK